MTHFHTSLVKSMVRILGFIALPSSIVGGCILLVIAEAIGIMEEMTPDA
jgi:hypothetical protein